MVVLCICNLKKAKFDPSYTIFLRGMKGKCCMFMKLVDFRNFRKECLKSVLQRPKYVLKVPVSSFKPQSLPNFNQVLRVSKLNH